MNIQTLITQYAENFSSNETSEEQLIISIVILTFLIIPAFVQWQNAYTSISPSMYRIIWGISYGINLVSVMIPGRLDNVISGV